LVLDVNLGTKSPHITVATASDDVKAAESNELIAKYLSDPKSVNCIHIPKGSSVKGTLDAFWF
jgi:tRNA splicing ligase